MGKRVCRANLEDLQEILELQYLAYQSEAELLGSRGRMNLKKVIPAICVLALLFTGCAGIGKMGTKEFKTSFFAMDTYISLTIYGENGDGALKDARRKVEELEALWSATDESSEIYALNNSKGEAVTVSDETRDLLEFAFSMADETDGTLDPAIYPVLLAWGFTTEENRIPDENELQALLQDVGYERIQIEGNEVTVPDGMKLDMGAVGKGYTGDVLTGILKEAGITSALLDLGGNVQVIGTKPDGSKWRLGLRSPFGEESYLGVIEIADAAVVTSGSYERYFIGEDGKRYGHIIDPATGYPAESGLASVTVVAEEGKLCDALSTALFVMGREEAETYWREHGNFDMILITEEKEVYITEGLEDAFSLGNGYEDMEVYVMTVTEDSGE